MTKGRVISDTELFTSVYLEAVNAQLSVTTALPLKLGVVLRWRGARSGPPTSPTAPARRSGADIEGRAGWVCPQVALPVECGQRAATAPTRDDEADSGEVEGGRRVSAQIVKVVDVFCLRQSVECTSVRKKIIQINFF